MEYHTKQDTRSVIMSEIMPPSAANFAGVVHGGYLMNLLDKVAYACSARYSGCYTVTLSADQIFFKKPIHVGDLVVCYANVNYVGSSSMEIGIKVFAETVQTGERVHTNSCYFTMVAVDDNGKPVRVKALEIRDAEDQRHFDSAVLRRKMRIDYQQQHDNQFKK